MECGGNESVTSKNQGPPLLRLKSPALPHLQGVKASHLLMLYGGWI